jgi:hypothetical protein
MRTDDDWLGSLAGHRPFGEDADEADALREALLFLSRASPAVEPQPGGEDAFIERARAAGLMKPQAESVDKVSHLFGPWKLLAARPWRVGLAGALLALVMVVGVWQQFPFEDHPSEILRQPGKGQQIVKSQAPETERDSFAAELEATGITTRRYERLGRFGIDADWPREPSAAQTAILRNHRLVLSDDGTLRIEFERSTP